MRYPDGREYPRTVTVCRPVASFTGSGDYSGEMDVVSEHLPADIQLSLRVRRMTAADERGTSDDTAWMMYCEPPVPLASGDQVEDEDSGCRYRIDAAGDWGTHTECVMRRV